jgi:asparagine synthase (glutamine-hydrolysing)
MCGFAGFLTDNGDVLANADGIVNAMAKTIQHRGPDDAGVWLDVDAGVALGHRRLSIVDLSDAGHQPMASRSNRYVVAFNGEIYNHLELRCELEKLLQLNAISERSGKSISWRGYSDTETLLAGFEAWGIEETLKKTVGMFAISLWDKEEKVLTLARDRMGEKPLYYGFQNNTFLFGSELKALKAHPDFLSDIDRDVLCLYLRHCYIPAPYSIYKGIKKLLPGTYIQVQFGDHATSPSLTPKSYWSMEEVAGIGIKNPFIGSDEQAINAVENQLKQSIGLQMMADVPLGAFLSGGVDSSAVVAIMQSQSGRPVKTFSIGFDEAGYNEADYAKAVAKHLGTDHDELYVSSAEAMEVIPLLGKMYDEPFADSSQIPTFLVSQIAKKQVTVSLSGDGGDELFGGYNRYLLADKWQNIEYLPFALRQVAGHLIKTLATSNWDAILQQLSKAKPLHSNVGEKLKKLANRLEKVDGVQNLYYSIVSEVDYPEQIVLGASEPKTWLTQVGLKTTLGDAKQQMMFMDAMTYLPDDILVKVDRAAMANSLETRVPFLDHRLVELASRLPMNMKIRDGKTKWILRQVLYQFVPKELIERPKAGFGIPLAEWLRGPLKEWVDDLLNEDRLRTQGYFNTNYVRKLWHSHLSGKLNNQTLLWNILMFQVWLEESK